MERPHDQFTQTTPQLSIVVPVFNEARNLRPLAARLASVLAGLGLSFEVILIDDGSRDEYLCKPCASLNAAESFAALGGGLAPQGLHKVS